MTSTWALEDRLRASWRRAEAWEREGSESKGRGGVGTRDRAKADSREDRDDEIKLEPQAMSSEIEE